MVVTINLWWVLVPLIVGVVLGGWRFLYVQLPKWAERKREAILHRDRRVDLFMDFDQGGWAPISDDREASTMNRRVIVRYRPDERALDVMVRYMPAGNYSGLPDALCFPGTAPGRVRRIAALLGPDLFTALAGLSGNTDRILRCLPSGDPAPGGGEVAELDETEETDRGTPRRVPGLGRNRRIAMGTTDHVD